jgi:tRNA (guanine-N7-)-methyltransferase
MSFGLAHGKDLDPAPVGVTPREMGTLPDAVITDPEAGRVDVRAWFARPEMPVEIEVGSGKGTFLLQRAAAEPGVNLLGIEWAREFWLYACDRCRRKGVTNVRVLHTDAAEFLKWRAPAGIAQVIHLYFPDPWPKARHNRRRIVQGPFLRECHRVLAPGGELRVVTDHDGYWEWMEREFAAVEGRLFRRGEFSPPETAEEGELVGTNFERKYRREGRPFHAAVLKKC